MKATWTYPEAVPKEVAEALIDFGPILQTVLCQRGIKTRDAARTFIAKDLEIVPDPFLLRGMAKAVELIKQSIENNETIAIFGDYDADGVTATALLTEAIQNLGGESFPYLPNRFDEGYGLNKPAVTELWQQGARLLITVDCGIRGIAQVAHARHLGFKVIVTDHHHPGSQLPDANAIINTRQSGDDYPFRELAGVGLSYKVSQALFSAFGCVNREMGLDLVALGTVADLAPLTGENRSLVAAGLDLINKKPRIGLGQLIQVSRLDAEITATDIAFRLAPRINASGRMESAQDALDLLTTKDAAQATQLAAKLDKYNRQRQSETRRVVERAEQALWRDPADSFLLFALGEGLHEGVVGLAASRLLEKYYKPVLVANKLGRVIKGSARSIPDFHITNALEKCSDLLLEFGGHSAAAGFQLDQSNADEFFDRMDQIAREQFGGKQPRPELSLDAVVERGQLNEALLDELSLLEPFGHGNQAPLLMAEGLSVVDARRVGANGNHLKMTIHDGHRYFDAIGFRLGYIADQLTERVDLAFRFEWNDYRGQKSPQLNIVDLRITDPN